MEFYKLIGDTLMGDKETPTLIYATWNNQKVKYITTNGDGTNHQYFESTKHPEKLSGEERHRVLHYRFGDDFDKDEIVNYEDLFIQFEFIQVADIPQEYSLSNYNNHKNIIAELWKQVDTSTSYSEKKQ